MADNSAWRSKRVQGDLNATCFFIYLFISVQDLGILWGRPLSEPHANCRLVFVCLFGASDCLNYILVARIQMSSKNKVFLFAWSVQKRLVLCLSRVILCVYIFWVGARGCMRFLSDKKMWKLRLMFLQNSLFIDREWIKWFSNAQ